MNTCLEPRTIRTGRPARRLDTPNSIRRYRLHAGLTLKFLAKEIDVHYVTLMRWETTGKGLKYTEQYQPLALIFGCSIEDLKRPQKILA